MRFYLAASFPFQSCERSQEDRKGHEQETFVSPCYVEACQQGPQGRKVPEGCSQGWRKALICHPKLLTFVILSALKFSCRCYGIKLIFKSKAVDYSWLTWTANSFRRQYSSALLDSSLYLGVGSYFFSSSSCSY